MLVQVGVGGRRAVAALDRTTAPDTCAAIDELLPFEGSVHLAKLAGDEIMVHLPLILGMERRRAVRDLRAGAVAFWPERQVLCFYFGRIQDEDAEVTLLGRIEEGLEDLIEAGEVLRRLQGREVSVLKLERWLATGSPDADESPVRIPDRTLASGRLTQAYAAIAAEEPAEIGSLLNRKGVMRPVGPLVYAEAETRKLHELLWILRAALLADGHLPAVASAIVRHSIRRLAGWYGLTDAGRTITSGLDELERRPGLQALPVLEEMILYVGRLNFWLDAHVPWEEFNGVLQS